MQFQDWATLITILLSSFLGGLGFVWYISWWLSGKFSEVKGAVYSESYKTRADLTSKLEYHEKHDDARFDQIVNEIWAVKIRNAARDGLPIAPVYKNPFINAIEDQTIQNTKNRSNRRTNDAAEASRI